MTEQTLSFWRRFSSLAEERSAFCCGVDPSDILLQNWGLSLNAAGVGTFCDRVLEAAEDRLAIFKPQSAFFERFGPAGLMELRRFIGGAQERGSLVLLDAKRGDIGHSLAAYAEGLIGRSSPMGPDALTLNAYLGPGTLRPAVERATEQGAMLFPVVLSSNPEGRELQAARLEDGRTVAEYLADSITDFNSVTDEEVGPVGAVIGATLGKTAASVVERLPKSLFLAPGIGAQGAGFDDVRKVFGQAIGRVIPTSSRGVLSHGPSVSGLRQSMEKQQEQAFELRSLAD